MVKNEEFLDALRAARISALKRLQKICDDDRADTAVQYAAGRVVLEFEPFEIPPMIPFPDPEEGEPS